MSTQFKQNINGVQMTTIIILHLQVTPTTVAAAIRHKHSIIELYNILCVSWTKDQEH